MCPHDRIRINNNRKRVQFLTRSDFEFTFMKNRQTSIRKHRFELGKLVLLFLIIWLCIFSWIKRNDKIFYFPLGRFKFKVVGCGISIYIMIPAFKGFPKRIEATYIKYGKYIQNHCHKSTFKYVSETDLEMGAPTIISNRSIDERPKANLILRYFRGMQDFLENTDIPWFYKSSDDNLIIMKRFIPYIEMLTKKYDPINEIVVKGEVCGGGFIHGGTGWVLSRKAAYNLYSKRDLFLSDKWLELPDDVHFGKTIKFLNLNLENDVHEGRFIAVDFCDDSYRRIWVNNYSGLIKCSKISNDSNLPFFVKPHPMKEVVAWHGPGNGTFAISHGDEFIDEIPPNIGFYHDNFRVHFCDYD